MENPEEYFTANGFDAENIQLYHTYHIWIPEIIAIKEIVGTRGSAMEVFLSSGSMMKLEPSSPELIDRWKKLKRKTTMTRSQAESIMIGLDELLMEGKV